ncbi:reverse transcriptase domain-containing protein [Tanacetum coccineum]
MDLLSSFHSYSIEHIKREHNKKADALSKLASMTFSKLVKEVLVEAKNIIKEVHEGSCGMHSGPSLVYGSKAVIPIERSVETKQVQDFDPKENEKRRREDLDILEERREMASIKEAHYKQSASKAEYQGKIGPTWEGPYMIRKAYGDEAYKLETLSGNAVD